MILKYYGLSKTQRLSGKLYNLPYPIVYACLMLVSWSTLDVGFLKLFSFTWVLSWEYFFHCAVQIRNMYDIVPVTCYVMGCTLQVPCCISKILAKLSRKGNVKRKYFMIFCCYEGIEAYWCMNFYFSKHFSHLIRIYLNWSSVLHFLYITLCAYFVLYAFLPWKVYSMLEIECTSHRVYEMNEVLGDYVKRVWYLIKVLNFVHCYLNLNVCRNWESEVTN
jgi:hypothetical protein